MRAPGLRMGVPGLVTVALSLGLTGCATVGSEVERLAHARRAVLDRPLLSAVPCIRDAVRTTFGVPAEVEGSYGDVTASVAGHVNYRLRVQPGATEGEGPAAAGRRTVRYELYSRGDQGSGVTWTVDFEGALRDEWMEQAFLPLSQCGARLLKP